MWQRGREHTKPAHTMIHACCPGWEQAGNVLCSGGISNSAVRCDPDCGCNQSVAADVIAVWHNGMALENVLRFIPSDDARIVHIGLYAPLLVTRQGTSHCYPRLAHSVGKHYVVGEQVADRDT